MFFRPPERQRSHLNRSKDETTESHPAVLSAWRRLQARFVTKYGIDTRHHTLVVAAIWTMLYLRDAKSID